MNSRQPNGHKSVFFATTLTLILIYSMLNALANTVPGRYTNSQIKTLSNSMKYDYNFPRLNFTLSCDQSAGSQAFDFGSIQMSFCEILLSALVSLIT